MEALIALLALQPTAAPSDFTVVEAQRTSAFAGKLGRRVSDHLIVERGGVRYHLSIAKRHTLHGDPGAEFRVGERLRLPSPPVAGHWWLNLSDVKRG